MARAGRFMAFRSGSTRLDRRRRERWRGVLLRLLLHGGVLALVAWWAYGMGGDRAENRNRTLEDRVAGLTSDNRVLREETDTALAARVRADERLAELRRRYRTDVPTGDEREALTVIRRRLGDGVPLARLVEVTSAAQTDPDCASEVTTRRFLLQTPLSRGASAAVGFADNAIVITGTGESARDSAGNPEAWFDATAPVRIAFTAPGGAESVSEGPLPRHHAVVIGAKAHNFTITEADVRGFVNVTEQVCDYP